MKLYKKKITNKLHVNWRVWIHLMQISIYKFVLIYNWQTHQENLEVSKKGLPLWAQVHGNVYV